MPRVASASEAGAHVRDKFLAAQEARALLLAARDMP